MIPKSVPALVYDLLAPTLLIITPFISFATFNQYSYTAPEIWICAAGLTAIGLLFGLAGWLGGWPARVVLTAGLLTLFVDLQFDWFDPNNPWPKLRVIGVFVLALLLSWAVRSHLSRIITAAFATMLVSTVALAAVEGTSKRSHDAGRHSGPATKQLPVLVHLILDEHIGIEGIPTDVPHGRSMKTFLRDFFDMYGFQVFGHAYSRYVNTYNAIPNIVNFSSEPVDGALTFGDDPYVVTRNKYFDVLGRAGYNIRVYQSTYMDLCAMAQAHVVECTESAITGIEAVRSLDAPLADKVSLIYQVYADLSALQEAVGHYYTRMRHALYSQDWTLPVWPFENPGLGPVPAMPLFDRLAEDVATSSPGDVFFVYLVMPHFPYVYDAMCNLRPFDDWEESLNPAPMAANDRESRARRYGLYLEQMRCLYRKLDAMFQVWQKAGIFDRLVIVMHGDHGSKIYEHRPIADNQRKLSDSDYVDGFSTLFAVKGPGRPVGYDLRIADVGQLLEEVADRQTGRQQTGAEQSPYVLLSRGSGKPLLRQPFAVFDDGRRERPHESPNIAGRR